MKVVLHIITGLNDGGAEAVLYRLINTDTHHQHCVISLMDLGKYGVLLQEKNIPVYSLNMPQGKVTISGLITLFKLIRAIKPDIIQTWMYHADLIGGVIGFIAGYRNIFWGIHHTTLEQGLSKKSTIFIAKLNALLSYIIPTKIICCADAALKTHQQLGFQHKKLVTVYNGYPIEQFVINGALRAPIIDEFSLNAVDYLLGMVGRFNPQKDHANLLHALAIVKQKFANFTCLLVGDGVNSTNQTLVTLIHQLGLENNVLLIGRRNDIPALMNAFDLHILSSFGEAFPNVLCEAMACGTPCVTTDVGDAALIVNDTGWIVPAKQPDLLAAAILSALAQRQNSSAWQTRQQNCRQRIVDNFSIDIMCQRYNQVWDTTI